MCRKKVRNAEDFFQFVSHAIEGFTSRVSVVSAQHRGLHIVTHRIYTGIRQHIHENIAVMQLEGVEARFLHLL